MFSKQHAKKLGTEQPVSFEEKRTFVFGRRIKLWETDIFNTCVHNYFNQRGGLISLVRFFYNIWNQ